MTYRPMVGDIGCVPMHAPGGPAIRTGELLLRRVYRDRLPAAACNYQHAFLYGGQGYVFQAQPKGAGFVELAEYHPDSILWLRRGLSVQQRQQIQTEMTRRVGTPYSYLDYAAIAAHALDLPDSDLLRNYVADSGHMICSQMCDFLHKQVGDEIFADGRWEGFVTPMDLAALAIPPRRE